MRVRHLRYGQSDRPDSRTGVDEHWRAHANGPAPYLERSPASPSRWIELGDAFQNAGDQRRAAEAFQRSLILGPNQPSVAFRNASFRFGTGENQQGLQFAAKAIAVPGYRSAAFQLFDENGLALEDVLRDGLPDASCWRILQWQMERVDADADTVLQVWRLAVSLGLGTQEGARETSDFLIRIREPELAVRSWAIYAGSPKYPQLNHVFNGS